MKIFSAFLFVLTFTFSAKAQYKIITDTDTIYAFDIVRIDNNYFYYLSPEEYNLKVNQKKIHRKDFNHIYSYDNYVSLSDDELKSFFERDTLKYRTKILSKTVGVNIFKFIQYSDLNIFFEKRIASQTTLKLELSKSKSRLKSVYGYKNINRIQLEVLGKYYFLKESRISLFVEAGMGLGYYLIYVRENGYPMYPDFEQKYFYYNRFGASLSASTGLSYWFTNDLKMELGLGFAYRSHFFAQRKYDFSRIPLQLNLAYNF